MSAKRSSSRAPEGRNPRSKSPPSATPTDASSRAPRAPRAPAAGKTAVRTAALVALLLLAFAALAMTTALSKSPTYDEPLHAVSAFLQLHHDDFRVDPEDPPLWKYLPALTTRADFIPPARLKLPTGTPVPQTTPGVPTQLDPHDPATLALRYRLVAEDIYHEWPFTVEALYPCGRGLPAESDQCPDTDAFIQRMRGVMLALAVALGAVIAWWGWQLGRDLESVNEAEAEPRTSGGAAGIAAITAIAATFLYCLDPNFLGHGPLVKNDVPLALIACGLFFAVWRAGRKLTILNAAAVALCCAAAVSTKFSGLLLGPIVALLLLLRAMIKHPWPTFWRILHRRAEKLVLAAVLLLVCFGVSYIGIWFSYGFRFLPTADPSIRLDLQRMTVYAAMTEMTAEYGHTPTPEEAEKWKPSLPTQALLILDRMKFLPQAWLAGLLYTYQSALLRPTFLLNDYSLSGWWYYFPVAILTKTPTATLLAAVAALGWGGFVLAGALRRRGGWRGAGRVSGLGVRVPGESRDDDAKVEIGDRNRRGWTIACLLLPPAFFLVSAMRSNLNLGLRHILPIYPFLYLAIALALAAVLQRFRQRTGAGSIVRWSIAALAALLALESFRAYPHYIAFFNTPSGGSRGGLKILSDSNLDWGQDLKLLAQWQQRQREAGGPTAHLPLYLVYFGLADPWSYGIDYKNFPGGYAFGPRYQPTDAPGILAISATALQGVYLTDEQFPGLRQDYARLRRAEPLEVLGGTIYLYAWPPVGDDKVTR